MLFVRTRDNEREYGILSMERMVLCCVTKDIVEGGYICTRQVSIASCLVFLLSICHFEKDAWLSDCEQFEIHYSSPVL